MPDLRHQPALPEPRSRRPLDDDVVDRIDALRWQEEYVAANGAPVSGDVLRAVRDDVASNGRLTTLIPPRVRFGDLFGLRVMAAVHRLAIERRAPHVAIHLPTLGGTAPGSDRQRTDFRTSVVDALADNAHDLTRSLGHTPQTNETGRAALLRCALSRLEEGRPVRLREIGTSAGLNLRADHLPGDPRLEAHPLPLIVDRVGCDLHPIDPTTQEGRTTLTSYVWVDDVERFERLRAALEVAERVPASVVAADAGEFVESLALVPGTTTVVWHSAMWLYLPQATRRRVLAGISALGSQAGPAADLLHASWEWAPVPVDDTHPFHLVVRRWCGQADDGAAHTLAHGVSHGTAAVLLADAGRQWESEPLSS